LITRSEPFNWLYPTIDKDGRPNDINEAAINEGKMYEYLMPLDPHSRLFLDYVQYREEDIAQVAMVADIVVPLPIAGKLDAGLDRNPLFFDIYFQTLYPRLFSNRRNGNKRLPAHELVIMTDPGYTNDKDDPAWTWQEKRLSLPQEIIF